MGRIFLDGQIGSIPPKSEEMTSKPGLARKGTVRQGKNWPRRGDGHRSNKFLNEIYRVIHIWKRDDNENKAHLSRKAFWLKAKTNNQQQPWSRDYCSAYTIFCEKL